MGERLMAIYPSATLKLLPQNASASKITPTQVIFHTAVSGASSLYGWFASGAGGANTESHFYVAESGAVEQMMDTERKAAAQWDGNAHGVSIETWDGGDPAHTPWNHAQLAALAALGRWLSETHGIPVVRCPGPQSPGFGWHELFPEWNHSGHVCPGALREAQIPQILALITGDDEVTDAQVQALINGIVVGVRSAIDDLAATISRDSIAAQGQIGYDPASNSLAKDVAAIIAKLGA